MSAIVDCARTLRVNAPVDHVHQGPGAGSVETGRIDQVHLKGVTIAPLDLDLVHLPQFHSGHVLIVEVSQSLYLAPGQRAAADLRREPEGLVLKVNLISVAQLQPPQVPSGDDLLWRPSRDRKAV